MVLETVILLVTALIALRMFLSKHYMAPATVFACIITMQSFVFYLVAVVKYNPSIFQGFSGYNFTPVANYLLLYFLTLVLVCFLMTLYIEKNYQRRTLEASDERTSLIDVNIASKMLSPFMFCFLLLVVSLIIIHSTQIDFDLLLNHRGIYLEPRQPTFFKIYNPVLGTFHKGLPLIGCLLGILMVFYLRKREYLFLALSGSAFLYCFFITVCFLSRFSVAQVFAVAVVLQQTKRTKISFAAIFMGLLGFVVYSTVVGLRIAVIGNFGNFGFGPLMGYFKLATVFTFNILVTMLINLFGGGFLLGGAFARKDFYYPLKYKLLSFSPFVSAIDGFTSVEYYGSVNRFSFAPTGPLSNFAEAYVFGSGFFIFFTLLLLYVIYRTTKYWINYPSIYNIFLMSFMYFGFMKMHSYELRSTVRIFYGSLVIATVFTAMGKNLYRRYHLYDKGGGGSSGAVPAPEQ